MEEVVVIGIGGGGCDIAGAVHAVLGGRAVAVNSDADALERCALPERLLIGPRPRAVGAVVALVSGRRAAEEAREALVALLGDARQVVVAVGLGGRTGTDAAPVIVRLALERGAQVVVAATLPFAFEGQRQAHALAGLEALRALGVPVVLHDHAELQLGPGAGSLLDYFKRSNAALAGRVSRLVDEHRLGCDSDRRDGTLRSPFTEEDAMDEMIVDQLESLLTEQIQGRRLGRRLLLLVGVLGEDGLPDEVAEQVRILSRLVMLQDLFDSLMEPINHAAKTPGRYAQGEAPATGRVDLSPLMQQIEDTRLRIVECEQVNYAVVTAWVVAQAKEKKLWRKGRGSR